MRIIRGFFVLIIRLVVLPVKVALALVGLGLRVGLALATLPVRVSWRLTRRAGLKAIAFLGAGVAAGLLLAPRSGRDLRATLMARLRGASSPSDPELADLVRSELAHSPGTWHLVQPEVAVVAGVVTLRGGVPHTEAADALVGAAQAVPGVVAVHGELAVEAADGSSPASAGAP